MLGAIFYCTILLAVVPPAAGGGGHNAESANIFPEQWRKAKKKRLGQGRPIRRKPGSVSGMVLYGRSGINGTTVALLVPFSMSEAGPMCGLARFYSRAYRRASGCNEEIQKEDVCTKHF